MRLFLSWSGEQSRALAAALRDYLPLIVQSVEPWFSPEDIDKGSRWLSDLGAQLEQQSMAIVCLTPESVSSSWLLFEVGALSKTLDASWVCPVLLGIEPSEVKGPLAQFQSTKPTKVDIRRLLGTLNKRSGLQLADAQIDRLHDLLWPDLQRTLDQIAAMNTAAPSPHRAPTDMLAEVLERVRNLERQIQTGHGHSGQSAEGAARSVADLLPTNMNTIAKIDRARIERIRLKQTLARLEQLLGDLTPDDIIARRNLEVELASARARLLESDAEIVDLKSLLDESAPR